jgi:2-polyprenyl-3-methyl-5-hydroxy-6-metoxy-1,4-benzoquinol methylase
MEPNLFSPTNKPPSYYQADRPDMLKYIPQTVKTTLEFGCGFGCFSALLKNKLHTESWAVEINSTAAEEAARHLDKVIHTDANQAVQYLPDGYFDCIIFFDILEHLVDPYSLLLNIRKKLTQNGIVVASIPNIRYYRVLVRLVVHGEWDYKVKGVLDETHLRFFTKKSILKMFDTLGYTVLTIEGIHPTHSRTYRIINALLLNRLSDAGYRQFAVVAKPI